MLLQGEDHICIRSMKTGLSLRECYAEASELDETLCRRLPIAFDSGLGYLTASPYRLGTGLTVYAVLHLPFCEESGVLEAYAPTAKNLGILIERVPGAEWERASAYRVSNRVTLGIREEEAVGNLRAIVEQLMAWERRYSDVKSAKERVRLADRLLRSVGVLRYAKLLECGECYTLLSDFRLAVRLGLLPFEQPQRITGAYYRTSDAVLDGYTEEPDAVKRCMLRARLVQEAVGG